MYKQTHYHHFSKIHLFEIKKNLSPHLCSPQFPCNPKFLEELFSVYQFSLVTVQRYKFPGIITEQVQELNQIAIQH